MIPDSVWKSTSSSRRWKYLLSYGTRPEVWSPQWDLNLLVIICHSSMLTITLREVSICTRNVEAYKDMKFKVKLRNGNILRFSCFISINHRILVKHRHWLSFLKKERKKEKKKRKEHLDWQSSNIIQYYCIF